MHGLLRVESPVESEFSRTKLKIFGGKVYLNNEEHLKLGAQALYMSEAV